MSALEQSLADYLRLRRSLGHDLAESAWMLPGFVAFLDARGQQTVTVRAALEWAQAADAEGRTTTIGPRRMTAVRGFARYLTGLDPATEVPPIGLMPNRQHWRQPFIYSQDDIRRVMAYARHHLTAPLRAATYETLIGLLASSGLRIGEAIKLDRSDIDWHEGVLLIRESKFGKSRMVPVDPSTLHALARYAELRDGLQPRPRDPSFFISRTQKRLIYAVVCPTFRQLITGTGVGAEAPSPPRLHDLRHTFAVAVLLSWYRAGVDVPAKLPALSTYLGHREPATTYWYLSAVPELLALAAARQETVWQEIRP